MAAQMAKVVQQSEFEAARERWDAFQTRFRDAKARVVGLQAALQLGQSGELSEASAAILNARAAVVLQGKPRSVRRLQREMQDAEDGLDLVRGQASAEQAAWDRARGVEAARIARELVPELRKAVRAMALAVEQLSQAMVDEEAVRQKLAESGVAPNGHHFLPNASGRLGVGTLHEWESTLSALSCAMRQAGALP